MANEGMNQEAWSKFEEVFAKDGKYDSEFNLPRRWNGKDFYSDLHGLLDRYIEKLSGVYKNETSSIVKNAKVVRNSVLETVRVYLHGYPAKAYECLRNLMKTLDEYPMYTDGNNNIGSLYRMTKVDENINDKLRIFHAPYDIRPKIRTYRYSIAGYPSLYLASSLELCEQEMKLFENKASGLASKYSFEYPHKDKVKILDFGFRPNDLVRIKNEEDEKGNESKGEKVADKIESSKREQFENSIRSGDKNNFDIKAAADRMYPSERYMLWYPLIAACAYVRANRDDAFAPEYIVPQLITQYMRNNKNAELVGIRYFSCYSEKASESGMNYVFPTSGDPLILKSGIKQFCPVLNEAFSFTEPEYIVGYSKEIELYEPLNRKKPSHAFVLTHEDYHDEEKVDLPSGLMYLAARSFLNCGSLKSIKLPEGLVEIGTSAFEGCPMLNITTKKKKLHIPSTVKRIGRNAFSGCSSLKGIILPEGIEELGDYAFEECSVLSKLSIPKSVKHIGYGIFKGIDAPPKVDVDKKNECFYSDYNCIIGKSTNTLIAGMTLDKSNGKISPKVMHIGPYAFADCKKLKAIKLPKSLVTIEDGAFSGCTELTELSIPESLTIIGNYAFRGCTRLTVLSLPKNLSIGEGSFKDCCELKRIVYRGTKNRWKRIPKGDEWDEGTGDYIVTCTDGELSKAEANSKKEKETA